MIPMIWNNLQLCQQLRGRITLPCSKYLEDYKTLWMSTTQRQNYFTLQQLLRGLQDPVDDTIGKFLLLSTVGMQVDAPFSLIGHLGAHL